MKRKGSILVLIFVFMFAILSGCGGGKDTPSSGKESGESKSGDSKKESVELSFWYGWTRSGSRSARKIDQEVE
ncbi:hypothetical protein RE628_13630 [Paenibacillus sp. D2_2]|uniref:hypothetical protein n=1 Tax=Paenibacillus sp. D2_2 TaxID=3073092 RepID=UPI00281514AA|nr:hypothetical protein [Paenibacillus sp. D2_2]WMT43202.1 hypothetical protein RE628_13630 [Paenibacillus sp. D2_2]